MAAIDTSKLASKYATAVDERFSRESQASLIVNSNYEFTGVKTVNVYSIPTVSLTNYTRTGTNRYGTVNDVGLEVQPMTIGNDRAFTFAIDKGDKLQSQMVLDAGKALNRQTREKLIPEYDKYVFAKVAASSKTANRAISTTAPTKENAYEAFLAGQEKLGNADVPDKGRICLCSYAFANLLKQDSAFMRYGDMTQEMLIKGIMGEVDGCKIVKVPSSRLPSGCNFMITHPMATVAPKQLWEFKTHENPPGISGWLVNTFGQRAA